MSTNAAMVSMLQKIHPKDIVKIL
uniref:Uncharacterized protein n=1 Tax=Arundo donax TaxID=35708 RepID=A0A0A9FUB9_ARUDO